MYYPRVTTGPTLSLDLYQLTMAAGYFHAGRAGDIATCEMFVRRLPGARRYLIAMGLEAVLDYLTSLRFESEHIEAIAAIPSMHAAMTPAFRDYLRAFRFTGDAFAVDEGTVVFENEPLVRIRAPIIEAQLVETYLLSVINHATMIASKASRIVRAARGKRVIEFGTRRTHPGAAIDAARIAYAVGFAGTSNVEAGVRFGLPVLGTAAHMWTMAHATEEEAFQNYFTVFPDSSILLIDTYDTREGARRAAAVVGEKLRGVRIDSGDLAALARDVRGILDREGCPDAKIVVSGDLDEHAIAALVADAAPIDTFGVGTELVTSGDAPRLSGVYKLVELERNGKRSPVAKFSEGKSTLPSAHQVLRMCNEDGTLDRDIIMLDREDSPTLAAGQKSQLLLGMAIQDGVRKRAAATLDEVRARVLAGHASLPENLLSYTPFGAAEARYPIEVSPAITRLVETLRSEHVRGST